MKPIITKKMIGEAISNWAKKQDKLVCAPGLWKKEHDHDAKGNCIPKGYNCNDINCMCYDCVKEHWRNGCSFGKQDGPEDIVKECDCDYKG